jgi:hypothetical protein
MRLLHQYDSSGDGSCPVHNSDCRIYERGVHVCTMGAKTQPKHDFSGYTNFSRGEEGLAIGLDCMGALIGSIGSQGADN